MIILGADVCVFPTLLVSVQARRQVRPRGCPSASKDQSGGQPPPPPPPPPNRPPQPRQIAPRVIRADSSGGRDPPLPGSSGRAPIRSPIGSQSSGQARDRDDIDSFIKRAGDGLLKGVARLSGLSNLDPEEQEKFLDSMQRAQNARKSSLGYGEWGADVELGDDWAYRPGAGAPVREDMRTVIDRRPRYPGTDTPRDSWLRPLVDLQGVRDRVTPNREDALKRIDDEATLNSRETRAAAVFAGVWLFLFPFGLGFFISRGFAEPIIEYAKTVNPEIFQLSSRAKIAGAKHIKMEDARMRFEASVGYAPPLTPEERFHHLQEAAHEFEEEQKEEMRVGLVNSISDFITVATFLTVLFTRREGRDVIVSTLGRLTQGMSQTGKAFIIILVADIFMGYHSEEGWTAVVDIFLEHYHYEVEAGAITVFIATVPVMLDSYFKYWIFKNLNRVDPSASVTLKEMDRH